MTERPEIPIPEDEPPNLNTLEQIATRRVFDTSRELMVARSPDLPDGNKDGIAWTCDLCGRGARIITNGPLAAPDAPCECNTVWAKCADEDCEQQSWAFVDYSDCDYHGYTRADDVHTTLRPAKEVVYDD